MTILLQRTSEADEQTAGGIGALQCKFGNLPLQQLSYHARLVALATQTTIVQTFFNPFDEPIEASYVFPLEMSQAVVACQMRVGQRVIHAQLKERQQAREDYMRAIRRGHRAALMEENRPETFSMSVGNIPPGEAVQIVIQTVSQLPIVHGEWTLRLPLVVAPRYTSGLPLPRSAVGPGPACDTAQVPDASVVSAPTLLPGFPNPIQLRLTVDIDMGTLPCPDAWIDQLQCSLHTVMLDRHSHRPLDQSTGSASKACSVMLLPGERVNRHFILRGRVLDEQTACSLVSQRDESTNAVGSTPPQGTFALTILAPRSMVRQPRRVFFLLDRSGSMQGWKYEASREALSELMNQLNSEDQFQLAVFDDSFDSYPGSQPDRDGWLHGTPANRRDALRWLAGVKVNGGTELGLALQQSLKACCHSDSARPAASCSIVLVTDGQITGEDSVLRLIDSFPEHLVPRLFCLGVDRAVNASVLQRLTTRTSGVFELAESRERLFEVIERFSRDIGHPALTDLSVSASSGTALQLSPRPTALFAGRSITMYGRYTLGQELTLTVQGRHPDGHSYVSVLRVPDSPTAGAEAQAAASVPQADVWLKALWGKQHIRQLEDELVRSSIDNIQLRKAIVDCSLDCHVLSRLTAYVAVDETEIVADGSRPHSLVIPNELPEGWSHSLARLDSADLLKVPRRHEQPSYNPVTPSAFHAVDQQATNVMLTRHDISDEQLADARAYARRSGLDLCTALVKLQYATHDQIARAIAEVTQTTFIPVSHLQIDLSVIQLLPESVARENHVLPMAGDTNSLTVVMSNPNDLDTIEKLRFIMNRQINVFCGAHDEIAAALNHYYGQIEGESADSILQEFTDTQIDFCQSEDLLPSEFGMDMFFGSVAQPPGYIGPAYAQTLPSEQPEPWEAYSERTGIARKRSTSAAGNEQSPELEAASAPIVRLVGLFIQEAVALRATHVWLHLEKDAVLVVYLIDGKLVERDSVPRRLWPALATRLKILGKIDITHSELPQSGNIKITIGQRETELNIITTAESILMEFVDQAHTASMPEAVEAWLKKHSVSLQR